MNHDFDVIVIGAGLAGLTAAFELNKQGQRVLVIEKSAQLGGRVHTLHWSGGDSDTGAQFFGARYPRIQSYLKQFGLDKHQHRGPARLGFLKSGTHFEINTRNPLALSKFVSLSALLKLAGYFALTPTVTDRDLENPHFWLTLDHENAHDWAIRELGQAWHDQLIAPTLSGFNYTTSASTAAFVAAKNLAYVRRQETVCALSGGLTTLLHKLAESLDVRCHTTAERLERTRHGMRVHLKTGALSARHVLLATTASAARELFSEASPVEKAAMQVSYGQSVWQGFQFEGQTTLKAYGHLMVDHPLFNVLTVERHKHPALCRGELVHVLSSQEGFDYCQEYGEEKLREKALALVKEVTQLEAPKAHALKAWREAIPHTPPGRLTVIDNYRRSLTGREDVLLVGDYVGMPCTEGAVESALFIVKRLKA